MSARVNLHASALRLGGRGLLVRGPSGSGKSSLALAALARGGAAGLEAVLVSDDQVFVEPRGAQLYGEAPAATAGLIEVRGIGLLSRPHVAETGLDLVVDLVPRGSIERLPEEGSVILLGIGIRRIVLPERDPSFAADVLLTLVATPSFWTATRAG
ncbi:HPr kinase/phosphorylase [Aureimonas phyllosphaerae]|uniref:Serine kinase of HPr protein (Carbohydrate metabolism regulator) n=1 Tax=Aureimonas phyllosphaerae TaxID=1166078 RepID=A0A7W6BWP7_9HYPH|nr:HPr kinase/phosphatase C-terminal domain-containing protein [Aureimonas phyllosphaerae]MBB3937434.1 serine kinase of HPr protein (carbohydrate metabolism regulator) [Aureimonas phyllosphaerae]MBB3961500.1 serine kinase of HPr protein (carbohydrate metabolism regulator) [Aureimonas phyllosphaerae]SFF38775.1 Hpr(Ser) kinase/phosphatase [Aureimonas phyllosphaerae]